MVGQMVRIGDVCALTYPTSVLVPDLVSEFCQGYGIIINLIIKTNGGLAISECSSAISSSVGDATVATENWLATILIDFTRFRQ